MNTDIGPLLARADLSEEDKIQATFDRAFTCDFDICQTSKALCHLIYRIIDGTAKTLCVQSVIDLSEATITRLLKRSDHRTDVCRWISSLRMACFYHELASSGWEFAALKHAENIMDALDAPHYPQGMVNKTRAMVLLAAVEMRRDAALRAGLILQAVHSKFRECLAYSPSTNVTMSVMAEIEAAARMGRVAIGLAYYARANNTGNAPSSRALLEIETSQPFQQSLASVLRDVEW